MEKCSLTGIDTGSCITRTGYAPVMLSATWAARESGSLLQQPQAQTQGVSFNAAESEQS